MEDIASWQNFFFQVLYRATESILSKKTVNRIQCFTPNLCLHSYVDQHEQDFIDHMGWELIPSWLI